MSSESGEKYAKIKHFLQMKTVLKNMLIDFDVREQRGICFSL